MSGVGCNRRTVWRGDSEETEGDPESHAGTAHLRRFSAGQSDGALILPRGRVPRLRASRLT
jgi:hypothetical protein